MQKERDQCVADIRCEVKELVADARDGGAQFTVPCDSWKSKMKKRRRYLSVLLDFITPDWMHRTVCAGVAAMGTIRESQA